MASGLLLPQMYARIDNHPLLAHSTKFSFEGKGVHLKFINAVYLINALTVNALSNEV